MHIGVEGLPPRSVAICQTSSSLLHSPKKVLSLSLVTGNRQRWLALSNLPLLRDNNPMRIDIHRVRGTPFVKAHSPAYGLQPRRFEKEPRNDGVSGTSGPNNDGSFDESGIRHPETGCRRCFTTLKWRYAAALKSKHASAGNGGTVHGASPVRS